MNRTQANRASHLLDMRPRMLDCDWCGQATRHHTARLWLRCVACLRCYTCGRDTKCPDCVRDESATPERDEQRLLTILRAP